jgi:diketogulonate reductase-like aldo/keto reductase
MVTPEKLVGEKKVVEIAKQYNKSAAQILLRWALQHNVGNNYLLVTLILLVVIPKATSKERINENANIFDFEISEEHMKTLDSLNKNYHCTWDPNTIN